MANLHSYWHLLVKNGNFTLLLISSSQEWQIYIPTDIYWLRMAFSHCYWHLVVKNGNWQIYLKIFQQIYPPKASWDIYYGLYLAAILYSARKVGVSSYFWIIQVVNSHLVCYSHVRCKPQWQMPSHCYWCLVVKNCNFTLLLTSSGQEWQFHIATAIYW